MSQNVADRAVGTHREIPSYLVSVASGERAAQFLLVFLIQLLDLVIPVPHVR